MLRYRLMNTVTSRLKARLYMAVPFANRYPLNLSRSNGIQIYSISSEARHRFVERYHRHNDAAAEVSRDLDGCSAPRVYSKLLRPIKNLRLFDWPE
jgi:hypothetical protein